MSELALCPAPAFILYFLMFYRGVLLYISSKNRDVYEKPDKIIFPMAVAFVPILDYCLT